LAVVTLHVFPRKKTSKKAMMSKIKRIKAARTYSFLRKGLIMIEYSIALVGGSIKEAFCEF